MSNAYISALHLLARREHGAFELKSKLLKKGYALADVEKALDKCQELALQSDQRFAESLCRTRIQQGYGPVKIQQELKSLKIAENIITQVLLEENANWLIYAQKVWQKKYKNNKMVSYIDIQKQKKFLQYRGFSMDIIKEMFAKL